MQQNSRNLWHIDSTSSVANAVESEDDFGYYDSVNTAHLCSANNDAHTVVLLGDDD